MAKDCALLRLHRHGNDQSVFQPLVIAFGVIVSHIFGNGTAQRFLPNENHAIINIFRFHRWLANPGVLEIIEI